MLVIIEGFALCLVLLVTCVVAIANGPVGGVALYEEDVQKRAIELGYTTRRKIRKSLVLLSVATFAPLFTLVPFFAYFVNGAEGFWQGFWQMSCMMWIMGIFDRLFIDWYWVGHTKAWEIPGTEDLKPYIPGSALLRKWTFTVIGFPVIAALIAGAASLV